MAGPAFVEQLKSKFGDKIAGSNLENIDPWIEVTPAGLLEVCRYLRDEPTLAFDYLCCISGVDYFHTDEKKAAKSEWQPHTEVVYHLYSMTHKHSLVLKVILPRWETTSPASCPNFPASPACGAPPIGTSAKSTTFRACTSPVTRICGASCAPKIGLATLCEKTTRCRSSITAFGEGKNDHGKRR